MAKKKTELPKTRIVWAMVEMEVEIPININRRTAQNICFEIDKATIEVRDAAGCAKIKGARVISLKDT